MTATDDLVKWKQAEIVDHKAEAMVLEAEVWLATHGDNLQHRGQDFDRAGVYQRLLEAESIGDGFNAEQFRRGLFNHSSGRRLSDAEAGYTPIEEQRGDFDREDFRRTLGIEAATHQTATATEAAGGGFDPKEFRRSLQV